MLQEQKKLIEEKENEIRAKEKANDNAWEDFEKDVWGRRSTQGRIEEQMKAHNASKEELKAQVDAIAARSVDLEERKRRLEEGRHLIASARGQMSALKGAVEREEKAVEASEATLKTLNTALSQQSETNKAYQEALSKAQIDLHMTYHEAVGKQSKAIGKLKGDAGLGETIGLQDAAMQSVQQAISETKRALSYCHDETLHDVLDDRAQMWKPEPGPDSPPPPPAQQNPNQVLANRLKEKIDELVRSLPKS